MNYFIEKALAIDYVLFMTSALLHNTCSGCHGAGLQDAMGPSLKPFALASKDDDLLIATITNGRS